METIELTPEKMQEMVNKKKEEIQRIISLPYEDFCKYLKESIIRTNIIVEGYEHTNEDVGLYDSILFIGVMSLREAVSNTLQWLESMAKKSKKVNQEAESTESDSSDSEL